MTPDPRLRERLQDLAMSEHTELDAAARARVRAKVLAASTKPSRARAAFGLSLVAACACALASWFWFARPAAQIADRGVRATPAIAAHTPERLPRAPAPCGEVITAEWTPSSAGGSELDLAARARFVAEARTSVRTIALESCSTRVLLERGALYVQAHDLQGGTLVVEGPLGSVEVHGTRFGVRASAHELRVTVDEGKVLVTPHQGAAVMLEAGQALRFGAGRKPKLEKLSKSIRAEVVPAEVEIEKVWREGTLRPPDEPFDPGTSITEDGRPMRKPRVVEGGATP